MDTQELLTHLDRRFNDSERAAVQRHRDLVRRVESLDLKVASAHGRISTHDGILRLLQHRVEQIGTRYHELANRIHGIVEEQVRRFFHDDDPPAPTGESAPLTRLDVKWLFGIVVATVAATVGFFKLIGKI